MSKPSDTYQFATDVGATVDPGVSRKATGFLYNRLAPPKWFNYQFHGNGLWNAYVDNLHNEADFLGEDYTWTGVHKYTSADGDDDPQWSTSRQHTVLVPWGNYQNLVPVLGSGWQFVAGNGSTFGMACNSASNLLWIDLGSVVPTGANLDEIRVRYYQGTSDTGSNRLKARLLSYFDLAVSGAPTESVIDVSGDDASHYMYATAGSGSHGQMILTPTSAQTSRRGYVGPASTPPTILSSYVLEVTASAGVSGGTVDRVRGVVVSYTEPTVNRNF